MELEPPPAKKLRGENGGGGGGENGDTLSNSNGANGSDKSMSVLNGETKMSKTAVGLEGDKKKIAPVKSSSGGALKSDSKMIIKDEVLDVRSRSCPYLDTINRHFLDFDFEKLCSVSLSHLNVYACLVCGKYFQGRGLKSHAYTHSVQLGHHVYINLHTFKFYCLPDNYEVIDSSLEDIKYVLNPSFRKEQIAALDANSKMSRAYDGILYLPGIVGLNNIKANDYCNVILHSLSNVLPIRDFFLRSENYKYVKRPPGDNMILLLQRFGELVRKLWNPRHFKAHVSPHEMLQAVVLCSKKRFNITTQGDPIDVLSWLLNSLHLILGGSKKPDSSIIYKTFQGSMKIYSKKIPPVDATDAEKRQMLASPEFQSKVSESPFIFLSLDLPAPPLFKDDVEENIIPQVSLFTIMSKFDGTTEKEYKTYRDSTLKRFELTKLPPYLIVCYKRFTKNNFFIEKNPTIVNFPVSNVDLREFLSKDPEVQNAHPCTSYDLVANIVHDGEPGPDKGTYRVHVLHQGTGQWYEMQDLHVRDILPQMITLSESYVQVYRLNADVTYKTTTTTTTVAEAAGPSMDTSAS